jgi:hypothetical protein
MHATQRTRASDLGLGSAQPDPRLPCFPREFVSGGRGSWRGERCVARAARRAAACGLPPATCACHRQGGQRSRTR